MESEILKVTTLGNFTLIYAGKEISCSSNRSKLIWNIIAYLLCHRGEFISSEELISIIWKQEKNDNPSGAMRTAIHRARAMLNELTETVSLPLLIAKNGGYMWNPEVKMQLDTEEFDRLAASVNDGEDALSAGLAALDLYGGKFLPILSSELWVIPMQSYYQSVYEFVLERVLMILEQEGRFDDGIAICTKAIKIDQYSEKIYQHLMRFLLVSGRRQDVVQVYEKLGKLLLGTFGIMPDQESRALYREALNLSNNTNVVVPESVQEMLSELGEINGALICDFDFFKLLYQAHARALVRSGQATHTALLTLKSRTSNPVAAKSLSLAMDNLEKHLAASLRKGDVITRCSSSQFLVMLPSANYENSFKVCQRFITSFNKKHPHSPLYVDFDVQTVIPSTKS